MTLVFLTDANENQTSSNNKDRVTKTKAITATNIITTAIIPEEIQGERWVRERERERAGGGGQINRQEGGRGGGVELKKGWETGLWTVVKRMDGIKSTQGERVIEPTNQPTNQPANQPTNPTTTRRKERTLGKTMRRGKGKRKWILPFDGYEEMKTERRWLGAGNYTGTRTHVHAYLQARAHARAHTPTHTRARTPPPPLHICKHTHANTHTHTCAERASGQARAGVRLWNLQSVSNIINGFHWQHCQMIILWKVLVRVWNLTQFDGKFWIEDI